jgi:hypothetical protein
VKCKQKGSEKGEKGAAEAQSGGLLVRMLTEPFFISISSTTFCGIRLRGAISCQLVQLYNSGHTEKTKKAIVTEATNVFRCP